MLIAEALIRVLVIGLGGGSLPLFIHDYFLQSCIDVVEIDPAVLDVATCWFGFSPGDRLKVHIADGLEYISNLAEEGKLKASFMMKTGPDGKRVSSLNTLANLCLLAFESQSISAFLHEFVLHVLFILLRTREEKRNRKILGQRLFLIRKISTLPLFQ